MGFDGDDGSVSIGPVGASWGSRYGMYPASQRPEALAANSPAQQVIGEQDAGRSAVTTGLRGDASGGPAPGLSKASAAVIKRLSFVFYSEAGTALVRIYNARTGELLREIPPRADAVDPVPYGPLSPGLRLEE